jgi:hypothetical protein
MWEFKPESFHKLPELVTILDAETAKLPRSAGDKPSSVVAPEIYC